MSAPDERRKTDEAVSRQISEIMRDAEG